LISQANQISGSQAGSQQRQRLGDVGRRPTTISPAGWLFRRQRATSSHGSIAPYKRGVRRFKSYCAHNFEYFIRRVAAHIRGVRDVPCLNGARAVRQVVPATPYIWATGRPAWSGATSNPGPTAAMNRLGRFAIRATPQQLALFGFPPSGHPHWTADTIAGAARRYPSLDLTAWWA
jgi:hypothetical protein